MEMCQIKASLITAVCSGWVMEIRQQQLMVLRHRSNTLQQRPRPRICILMTPAQMPALTLGEGDQCSPVLETRRPLDGRSWRWQRMAGLRKRKRKI